MEAALYTRCDDGSVSCGLCSHRCVIASGRRGICGVRENRGGTLHTLVYGSLVARAVDPIEKKPLYHFLPGTTSFSIATVGCNLRCEFCQNWQISQSRPGSGRGAIEAEPEEIVADACASGCASIAYTYTEPTIFFEYARDTARLAHQQGLANVFVTNGFQTPETIEEMAGLVDAANVDLKSFSDEFYREHCGARLQPVLESIAHMHRLGIHVEVTTLVIPGWNDEEGELRSIAEFIAGLSIDVPWHVSRFHPDYKATDRDGTPPHTIDAALAAGAAAGLRYTFAGNVGRGEANTVCPSCQSVLVRRRGYHTELSGLSAGEALPLEGFAKAKCGSCGHDVAVVVAAPRT